MSVFDLALVFEALGATDHPNSEFSCAGIEEGKISISSVFSLLNLSGLLRFNIHNSPCF